MLTYYDNKCVSIIMYGMRIEATLDQHKNNTDWLVGFWEKQNPRLLLIQTNVSNFLNTLAFFDQMSSKCLFIKSTKLLRIPLLAKGTRFVMALRDKR